MVKGGPIPCGFESWGKRQEEETAFNIMAWQAASAFSSCRSSSASNLSFKIKAVCSDITPASSCTKRSSCGGAWAADALMLVDEGGLEVVCVFSLLLLLLLGETTTRKLSRLRAKYRKRHFHAYGKISSGLLSRKDCQSSDGILY